MTSNELDLFVTWGMRWHVSAFSLSSGPYRPAGTSDPTLRPCGSPLDSAWACRIKPTAMFEDRPLDAESGVDLCPALRPPDPPRRTATSAVGLDRPHDFGIVRGYLAVASRAPSFVETFATRRAGTGYESLLMLGSVRRRSPAGAPRAHQPVAQLSRRPRGGDSARNRDVVTPSPGITELAADVVSHIRHASPSAEICGHTRRIWTIIQFCRPAMG